MKTQKLIECVPNFSEGRRRNVINKIAAAGKKMVLATEWNADHNRSLMTLVGEPEKVYRAVWEMIKVAVKQIDMRTHKGEHPRIGAVDVVPFVPVSGVTINECVKLAERLGKQVGKELKIPVFLYEAAATQPGRVNLADVRKGEYEGLVKEMRKPNFGPNKMHPTAGAMVIGARKYLVAYNVNLDTDDVQIAKDISNVIREKNGGLPGVKALGFAVDGKAQISMNLVDFERTNIDGAYAAIKEEAEKRGVKIANSEIYGMIPLEALVKMARDGLQATDFKSNQILETRIYE
ncbi:MAG: hypothetical protein UX80_C0003G0009 [Candidatus Amesbacteria bacterium GW2011_GWA2_47_11b]|uniref:glutamate formimidoyltransferase n=2 Tax=Candidatus Amesiibacteriota TaxID=1752730 RepID=A0A0G1SEZ1_9BACT|nr:MAG: hypothetical protein UX42_C0022G0007 [Microgenomates group bacterium GW2011_GWC1_46_20]KKU58354.1 MAG: hypothetical protein UX80_C0003G0009 [Candidatus Amesbacteria bacterium GW2011_GWA2_47_11b]KKU68002.1 MAG: hypothetical protein UX92_C0025G0006 [Candidatus Amesbacteria bacterium GW2011_GWA1_47_20]